MVDAVRGAAVLCMIQWHCSDAWIGGPLRDGEIFGITRIVGGLAAPLFLLLAGVSAALVFDPARVWSGVRRGIGIVAGGYAFKLWAWVVDYGAIVERRNWGAIVCDAVLLYSVWRAAAPEKMAWQRRAALALLAAVFWVLTWMLLRDASRTPALPYRLDVLQAIGVCVVVVNGVLYGLHRFARTPAILASLAVVVALVTPSLIGVDLSWMPVRVADYVARTTADPALSGARFPLFPWLAYTLLGAAIGARIRERPIARAWDVPFFRNGWVALAMAILVGLCVFEPTPSAQLLLLRTEQPRNLLRLVWNAAVATGFAGLSSIVLPTSEPLRRAVLSLGRHSLLVYVVHLEIVFGLPCSPIRQTLGLVEWVIGTAVITASMIGLSFWLDARDTQARPNARDAVPAPSAMKGG